MLITEDKIWVHNAGLVTVSEASRRSKTQSDANFIYLQDHFFLLCRGDKEEIRGQMDSRIHVNFHYPWLPDDSHENGKQGFWRFLSFHHQQRLLVSCPPPSPFSPPPYIYQYICTCSQNQFHSSFFLCFFQKIMPNSDTPYEM